MFSPDFIVIPYVILADKRVRALDARVYGIIYWMTRLKGEKCFASNKTLAEMAMASVGGTRKSIINLEKCGYIRRIFCEGKREEVVPLVHMGVFLQGQGGAPTGTEGGAPTGTQNKSNVEKEHLIHSATEKSVAVDTVSNKLVKIDESLPMSQPEFTAKCEQSPQRHIQIIGWWAYASEATCTNYGQWKAFIKRHLRAARSLAPFTDEQIGVAMGKMEKSPAWNNKPTLETVLKYLV